MFRGGKRERESEDSSEESSLDGETRSCWTGAAGTNQTRRQRHRRQRQPEDTETHSEIKPGGKPKQRTRSLHQDKLQPGFHPPLDTVAMVSWRIVMFGLFYCFIRTGVTKSQTRAKVKRGSSAAGNPTFYKTMNDVHLLYEILMAGVRFEPSGEFSVDDAELSSLRQTRNLNFICEEIFPKKLTEVFGLIAELSEHSASLHQEDFERILMTLVYTTQKMISAASVHQRGMWGESFVGLYKAIKRDLARTN
ncbi:protein FAM180A-like isoform X2 [Xiphophorus hellerii]|uniref:protein FAM180A-like isoform X2 n=1 Tax=Xiphophorus hellerii TaxID=8084 RepID=UPI0013B46C7C|nr:protein FAM180A-like isoform X2 [Xiphophorus hellerii]